jgi:hypothetical protein
MANKYVKKYSTSLATKEIHSKTTLRFYLTQLERPSSRTKSITNVGEDAVKQEILNTVGGNAN